ncbi:MAG: hypothetical protein K2Q14_02575 [Gammaproteobacteria bacterium]|nr:hypothetical protein [Gammaproteobacteria bacterium]
MSGKDEVAINGTNEYLNDMSSAKVLSQSWKWTRKTTATIKGFMLKCFNCLFIWHVKNLLTNRIFFDTI